MGRPYTSRALGRRFEIWKRDADGVQPATRGSRRRAPGGTRFLWPRHLTRRCWRFCGHRPPACRHLVVALAGGNAPAHHEPLRRHPAAFSPDSKMLAVQSAESGRWGGLRCPSQRQTGRSSRRAAPSIPSGRAPASTSSRAARCADDGDDTTWTCASNRCAALPISAGTCSRCRARRTSPAAARGDPPRSLS